MKNIKKTKLKGTEIFAIIYFTFFMFAGFWDNGFSFDDSLFIISGSVCGVLALKKWIVKFLDDQIKKYDKHDENEVVSFKPIRPRYRLISGFIILAFSIAILSFMYFSRIGSMFIVGFILSWFFIGLLLLLDSNYSLYGFLA